MISDEWPELLNGAEAAERCRVTVQTIKSWRAKRMGPPWKRIGGKVWYDGAALRQWIADQPGGGQKGKGKR